jgi:hypothetical protein
VATLTLTKKCGTISRSLNVLLRFDFDGHADPDELAEVLEQILWPGNDNFG